VTCCLSSAARRPRGPASTIARSTRRKVSIFFFR
jgi:hypothetical protein